MTDQVLTTNKQSNAESIVNHAVGKVVSDNGVATAETFVLGFVPRVVRFHNLTDQISDEWFEGMAVHTSLHTVANGTRTLEATNGITVNDGTGVAARGFTVTAVTMVASKTFYWEAIG